MNRSRIIAILIVILLSGCRYDYFSSHGQKKFRRNYADERIQNQVKQLRVLDTFAFKNGGGVYIQEIMAKRNGTGVYAYNRRSSHFGRVHFFEYKNDSVILLSRSNEDSLRTEVERFLSENEFTKHQIQTACTRLKSVFDILSTDSF